jgi:predicted PurR-regulated permease PerM
VSSLLSILHVHLGRRCSCIDYPFVFQWAIDTPTVCSFIPVAGCIISTFPIGFVALTEYGFMKLALVILMVFCVHAVEAYGLNPAIYSAHLRLHPLLVLAVLVIAEHSLGVWGLLLAVPLTVFTLDYLIRYVRLPFPSRACLALPLLLYDGLL